MPGWTHDRDSDRFLITDFFIEKHAGPEMVQHHIKDWLGNLNDQGTLFRAEVSAVLCHLTEYLIIDNIPFFIFLLLFATI